MNTPQNPPSRHHYVPQFYLSQWTSHPEGKLWAYERQYSGAISEDAVSPKATAHSRDLYSMRAVAPFMPEPSPAAIETEFFSKIDNDAARVLQKLVTGAGLPLGDTERTAWALFLNSLLERGPRTLLPRNDRARAVAEQSLEELRARATTAQQHARLDEITRKFDTAAAASNAVLGHMIDEIRDPQVIAYFKSCKWHVFRFDGTVELITTDAPVVINAGRQDEPIHMITLALSPTALFVMYRPEWEVDDELIRLLVLSHNFSLLNAAPQRVYSRGPLRDGSVLRMRQAVEKLLRRAVAPVAR